MTTINSRERPSFEESNNVTVKRCFYAYEWASEFVKDKTVADIGCGTGYGTIHLAKYATKAVGVDYSEETVKQNRIDNETVKNLEFVHCKVPPIALPDNTFDVVTAFQFIEHLEDRVGFLKEVKRILKPGGTFLCTTVNAKKSLARNPYHVHEYTFAEMGTEFKTIFSDVEVVGLQGNERVNKYYDENNKWVRNILKWDILGLHKIVPSSWITLPYNYLTNKMRDELMEKDKNTTDINSSDFFLTKEKLDDTWDIFIISKP